MKFLLFANTDWYLYNFRLPLAKAIREAGNEVVLLSPDGEYGTRIERAGLRWISVDMDRQSLNPWSELKVIWRIARIYKREKPDLVHHFTIKCVIYGSIAATLAGIKNRVHAVAGLGYVFSNDHPHTRTLRLLIRYLMRGVLRGKTSRLILQNADDRHEFIMNGLVSPDQVRLIRGSGVNTSRFTPVIRNNKSAAKILLATRLLWDKGIAEFVEAAKLLRISNCRAEFLLAGVPDPGSPAKVPEETIAEWSREGFLRILGHIDNMAELLRDVDIVVLPSSYREGVPRILLEAASSGLPIITTNTPGCRDIVADNINGFLIPIHDSQALANKIRCLVNDPQLRKDMGNSGREKVLSAFDEKLVITETLKVYSELIGPFCHAET